MMFRLRHYCRTLYGDTDKLSSSPPNAYVSYVHGLRELLQPIVDFIIATEKRVKQQNLFECNTIIWLNNEFEPHFKYLIKLYALHKACILDHNQLPGHICTTYLYASLLHECNNSPNPDYQNLCGAMLISTIRVYLTIIDTWWMNGYIEDYKSEFVLKK